MDRIVTNALDGERRLCKPVDHGGGDSATGPIGVSGGPEAARDDLKGRSVLLIEDSWLIAQGYKSLIEHAGMVVMGPAATVSDAEGLLLAHSPDMAIVDINLQGNMSYDLIEAMLGRGIPVLVISGNDVPPAIAAKVDAVLTKPVGGHALMATLRLVAGAKRQG